MRTRFAVNAVEAPDHWVVSVEGELDGATVRRLGACLDELADRAPCTLILDTAKVRIVEFTGAETLMGVFRQLRQRGARVALRPSDRGAYKVLNRIGFHLEFTWNWLEPTDRVCTASPTAATTTWT